MPRKSKITAVPIEPSEQPAEVTEEKTDAERMTDVINQVSVAAEETPELEPIAPSEPVVLKAKAKRASRAKPKEESLPSGSQTSGPKEEPNEESLPSGSQTNVPEVEVTSSSLNEAHVDVTIPEEEAKKRQKLM